MFKILLARLHQYMNHELLDVQAVYRKVRGTSNQIANIHWIIKKAREFQKRKKKKKTTSALLTVPEPLTVWTPTNCEKF